MKKRRLSLAVASTLLSCSLHAEIHFGGFASIVGGTTTASDEQLYGYDNDFNFKQDSLVAIQASSDLENGLGVTVQLTAKGADDWDPEFKWAFISYDVNDNLRILAGRQRAPFYMYSDFLDVSYAYPWISPPEGVYDLIFDSFDGLGAVYNTTLGDIDATFHGIYGRNTDEITAFGQSSTPDVTGMVGLASTFTYNWLTVRAGYFVAEASLPFNDLTQLAAGWQQAGQATIASDTLIDKDDASFLEFGFQMNFDEIILVGEYTKLEIDNSPLADEESYYVMAGYQFDRVLVHITYGMDDNTVNNYTAGIPYGLDPSLDFLKGTTEGFLNSQVSEEDYITLGARYEFHDSAALKFEYTDFSDDDNSNRDAGLLRIALVTVF